MAIGVPDNFNYGGKKPNFDRDQFTTREAMLAFPADFLDEGHISYCKEDKKHYKWNGSEWVEFAAGGGGGSSVGVNLIKSPNFEGSEWENSNAIIRDDVVARANVVELPTSNSSIRQIVYGLVEGKRYTLSFVYHETHSTTGPVQGIVGVAGLFEDIKISGGGYWNGSDNIIEMSGDTLTHNTMSFTAISDTVEISFIGSWGKAQYWHVKLEEGDTATEWTDWTSDSLVSGFGIKTINGQSILGEGNIEVEGGGGFSGDYNDLKNKPTIPTKVSELTNDSGYVTGEEVADMVGTPIVDNTSGVAVEPTALRVWNEIEPNKLYVWGEIASLELEFVTPADDTIVNEYMVQFTSGATATTLTLPDTIRWMAAPNIQPNKTYHLSVINNLGVIGEFGHE